VEQLGIDNDVLHPALPLRHTRTPRKHGRTVNSRPLVLRCESQRIVSTLVFCRPGREHTNTVRSESRCALRLRYVHLVVSIEVAVEVCCCLTVFSR
jgi:hypothetical protein